MYVPISFAEQEFEFNKCYLFEDFCNELLKNDNWNDTKKKIFIDMLEKRINDISEDTIIPVFNDLLKKDAQFSIKILKFLKYKNEILFNKYN